MTNAPHILIVEDDRHTAEMLSSYFRTQGYEVTSVGWGEEALAFTRETVPDVVVLDIRLPDIDGYEVCRRLRVHRRTERVPIIFLTEKKERMDRLTGLELGAVDYITKPFDIQELRLRIRNVLRRREFETVVHPITRLPTGSLVDECLEELLTQSDWAVLSLGLRGLEAFGETYGFLARDDVLRAVALMMNHAVEESGDAQAFVGQLGDSDFLIITVPDEVASIREDVSARLEEAMAFFYPRVDWEAGRGPKSGDLPCISLALGVLTEGEVSHVSGLEELRDAILEAQAET